MSLTSIPLLGVDMATINWKVRTQRTRINWIILTKRNLRKKTHTHPKLR